MHRVAAVGRDVPVGPQQSRRRSLPWRVDRRCYPERPPTTDATTPARGLLKQLAGILLGRKATGLRLGFQRPRSFSGRSIVRFTVDSVRSITIMNSIPSGEISASKPGSRVIHD